MEIKEVFEPIINFMKSFQKKDKDISKQAAKDRLKLVLMQDRASVSPDFFEMMKKEIIDVIKKYIEIDEESLEVQLTRGLEAGLEGPALYANIPIKNIKPVASNGDEDNITSDDNVAQIAEAVAGEILEEARKKVEEVINENLDEQGLDGETKISVEAEIIKEEDGDVKNVESIAENVAKEMKKTIKSTTTKSTTAKATTKTTKTAKTTKAKTTTKRTTKKSTVAE